MTSAKLQYISVSRRTDIPRFYTNDFFTAWEQGHITYNGGYGRSYTVSLEQKDVLGYIFWSKDYTPFINHPSFLKLIEKNNAIFHYTINNAPDLEQNIAPLEERLATLSKLCNLVGNKRVLWRFDPICKYRTPCTSIQTTTSAFFKLLPQIAAMGISRCYFSFMSHYAKQKQRNVIFEDFSLEERKEIGLKMLEAARPYDIDLYNCCNQEIVSLVQEIKQAHCVEDELLRETDRFGIHPKLSHKPTRKGCGCYESRDIGSYSQVCNYRCVYCYANPAKPEVI
jgi:DNA repair photolyase